MKKICTKCNIEKPFSEFHKCKGKKFNLTSACKHCRNKHSRAKSAEIGHDVLYRRSLERNPNLNKERYEKHAEVIKERVREYREENPDKVKEQKRQEYARNKRKYLERAKSWASNNPNKRREIIQRYYQKNKSDPCFIAAQRARKMIYRVLDATGRKKKGKTFSILGYDRDDLIKHIESLFEDGMSWDNRSEWHIDHIVPISELIALGVTSPRKINALNNLRPMWATENLSKGDKFELLPPEAEGMFRVKGK